MSFEGLHDIGVNWDMMVVLGSGTDFGVDGSPHIDDAVYKHLKIKWGISDPPGSQLDEDNKAWDNMGQFHMYVQRYQTVGDRQLVEAVGWFRYVTTLRVHLVMKRLTMGLLPDTIQNASVEVQRIFWEYSPHWIAGIQEFDNIREYVLDESDNPANPFKNTYHVIVEANAYYTKASDFAIDTAPYNPVGKKAGQLTYL